MKKKVSKIEVWKKSDVYVNNHNTKIFESDGQYIFQDMCLILQISMTETKTNFDLYILFYNLE